MRLIPLYPNPFPTRSLSAANCDEGICQNGQFNEQAVSAEDCIHCFCFGATSNCRSSNMYRVALNSSVLNIRVLERTSHSSYKDVSEKYSPMHVRTPLTSGRRFRSNEAVICHAKHRISVDCLQTREPPLFQREWRRSENKNGSGIIIIIHVFVLFVFVESSDSDGWRIFY